MNELRKIHPYIPESKSDLTELQVLLGQIREQLNTVLPEFPVPLKEIRERLNAVLPEELWSDTSKNPYWGSHFMRTLLRCATEYTYTEDVTDTVIDIVPVYVEILWCDIYQPEFMTPDDAKKILNNTIETVRRVIDDKIPKTLEKHNNHITLLQAFGDSI